jgi:hypothetical protein
MTKQNTPCIPDFGFEKIDMDMDLTAYSFEAAALRHFEKYQIWPTTLIVSPEETVTAYEIQAEKPSLPRVVIVPVPGMPVYAWALGSPRGFIYSPGA